MQKYVNMIFCYSETFLFFFENLNTISLKLRRGVLALDKLLDFYKIKAEDCESKKCLGREL